MAKEIFISRILQKYIKNITDTITQASARVGYYVAPNSPISADYIIGLRGCPDQEIIKFSAGQNYFVDDTGNTYIPVDQDNKAYLLAALTPNFNGSFGLIFFATYGKAVTGYQFNLDPCIFIEYSTDNGSTWIRAGYINMFNASEVGRSKRFFFGPFPAVAGVKICIRLMTGEMTQHIDSERYVTLSFQGDQYHYRQSAIYYSNSKTFELVNNNRMFPSFGAGDTAYFMPKSNDYI